MYYFSKKNIEPFGVLFVVSTDDIIVGISCDEYFIDRFEFVQEKTTQIHLVFYKELNEYISGTRKTFDFKTDFIFGTDFQRNVWNELKKVKYGNTISYKELAQNLGIKAIRAVGTACSKNPLPLIFPCHRVINASGKLGKYNLGKELKPFLLELESEL